MSWTDEQTNRFDAWFDRKLLALSADSDRLWSGEEPTAPDDVDAEVARLSARAVEMGVTRPVERPSGRVLPKRTW